MRIKQVIGLVILFIGPFSISTHGQVVATWTDGSGNWSNSSNWSTCAPGACPVVPNDGSGIFYNVQISGVPQSTITFDMNSAVVNGLTIIPNLTFQNNGAGQSLTIGDPAAPTPGTFTNAYGTFNWVSGNLTINGPAVNYGQTSIGGNFTLNGDYQSLGPDAFTSFSGSTLITGSVSTDSSSVLVEGNATLAGGFFSGGQMGGGLSVSGNLNAGNVSIVGDLSEYYMGPGSHAVIGGLSSGGDGTSIIIDGGSLIVGGVFVSSFTGGMTLENGSAMIVNGDVGVMGAFGGPASLNITGGSTAIVSGDFTNYQFSLASTSIDPNSSLTVEGNFANLDEAQLNVGGSLVVKGNFLNSNGTILVNPSATLVTSTYSQSGGVTDISGVLAATSFKQSGGTTTIESGGLLSTNTFKATGGTVAVNGILDPTAVEIGSGAGLQGTGTITGNVAMGGTLTPGAPGTPGTFTIFGNYEQIGNGTLEELMGPHSQSFLHVSGDVALDSDSVLSITLLGGFNPLGDTFSIMDYSSLVGQFANGSSFLEDGFLWDVSYGANQIDVTAVSTPEPSSLLLLCIGVAVLALVAQRKTAKTHLFA